VSEGGQDNGKDLEATVRTLPAYYDSDPGRFAANQVATSLYSRRGDIHPAVSRRLAAEGCHLVLDLGGGNGVLARE
jgi:hypothetical protein